MSKVMLRDLAPAGLCASQSREWFKEHGLSWRDFAKHGIDAEVLRATGCPLAARAIVAAEKRELADGQVE